MEQRVDSSAQGAITVTPSDTVNLVLPSGVNKTKGIYVGVSGNVKVRLTDNTEPTFVGLASGIIHPISAVRVYATGTTATSILAVY